jgi:predicted metal-dependent phosphoesterase TrpH
MAQELIDLHLHSRFSSDGDFWPGELVAMAKKAGFRAISISDHDSLEAYPQAVEQGREAGVEVIPSLEVTTLFGEREFHLLMPFVDSRSPAIQAVLDRARDVRFDEGCQRVEKLRAYGFPISWEEVLAAIGKEGGRALPVGVFIARILLDKVESRSEPRLSAYYRGPAQSAEPDAFLFYGDYFAPGRPAYVPKRYINLLHVLKLAPATGAVPVLAHPGADFVRASRRDLETLREAGLKGLEVYTSYHQPPICADSSLVALYLDLAERLGLVPTAGSDFHGRIKPFIPFGFIQDGRYWMVEHLRNGKR